MAKLVLKDSLGGDGAKPPSNEAAAGLASIVSWPPEPSAAVPNSIVIDPARRDQFAAVSKACAECADAFRTAGKMAPLESLFVLALEARGYLRPGFLGKFRGQFEATLEKAFGPQGTAWEFRHFIQGRSLSVQTALEQYDAAYTAYLRAHPEVAEWLQGFGDVYDTDRSNISSGTDHSNQENPKLGHHHHDIAIRKAMSVLGLKFSGDTLLRVRGRNSEGAALSPGEIPFHRPDLIPTDTLQNQVNGSVWWKPGSVEAFYQTTRHIRVPAFNLDGSGVPLSERHAGNLSVFHARVASRYVLKTLSMMFEGRDQLSQGTCLSELSSLPWMLDPIAIPVNPDGLPRKFSREEVAAIVNHASQLFHYLLRDEGDRHKGHLLVRGWGSPAAFQHASSFAAAVGRWAKGNEPIADDMKDFPSLGNLAAWSDVLPKFYDALACSNRVPVFMARDAFAVMEYMKYRHMVDNRPTPDFRALYLHGSPTTRGANARKGDARLDSLADDLFLLAKWAVERFPAPEQEGGEKVRGGYSERAMFYLYCVQQVLEQDAGDRDLWNQLFVSLQDSFDGSVPPLVLVDTDGTGKTLLFFKALIEHSARRTGVTVDVDVLMGAQRPNNLGIPNLGSKFVPDIHWPFMFDRHELEPIFTFEQSPTKLLSLLFESLARYNRAVDDSRAAQAASMPW